FQFTGRFERAPIGQLTRHVNREFTITRAPCANGVVIFEAEPERVHPRVTGRAGRVPAMLFELLPQRAGQSDGLFIQIRHRWWRRRWRRVEDVFENPFATQHWRRARWVG